MKSAESFENWWGEHCYSVRDTSEKEQYKHEQLKTACLIVWNAAQISGMKKAAEIARHDFGNIRGDIINAITELEKEQTK